MKRGENARKRCEQMAHYEVGSRVRLGGGWCNYNLTAEIVELCLTDGGSPCYLVRHDPWCPDLIDGETDYGNGLTGWAHDNCSLVEPPTTPVANVQDVAELF